MVLKLEPMTKVRVVCMQPDTPRVIDSLYEFGSIQITRSRQGEPGTPLAEFREVSEELIFLRSAEKMLGVKLKPEPAKLEAREALIEESKQIRAEVDGVKTAEAKLAELKSTVAQHKARLSELEPFEGLAVKPATFDATQRLKFHYFELKSRPDDLRKSVAKLPSELLFVKDAKGRNYCLAGVDAAKDAAFVEKASKLASEITIPKIAADSFAAEAASVRGKISGDEREAASLSDVAASYAKKRGARIALVRAMLEEYAKKAELPNKFGRTQALEVIEGWVPSKNYRDFEKRVTAATSGRVALESSHTKQGAPTLMNNPPVIRRFEFMVRFFSLPNQAEYDPTLFIAITFPIIFGMIFGDIGYGALVVLIALALYAKTKKGFWRQLAGMMLLSGIMTAVWGWVFGEFMGGEEMLGAHLHPIIERGGEGIPLLMVAALIVGLIHLGFGLVIGAYTNFKHGHKSHALAKVCWLGVELTFLLIGISLFAPYIFSSTPVILGLALVSIVGLYKFEGVPGLVELPGLLSNLLSYLRIMALGLSGVILAKIVNQIPVESAFHSVSQSFAQGNVVGAAIGVLPLAFFALVLVLGHAVALLLGVFESGIQSLRLHYVEFFSKFYHGGGLPFLPLREK